MPRKLHLDFTRAAITVKDVPIERFPTVEGAMELFHKEVCDEIGVPTNPDPDLLLFPEKEEVA